MSPHPPDPPLLSAADIAAIVEWLTATADWLRHEQAEAAAQGHAASPEATANLRLYEEAALLFREAYHGQ
jgi:hypothetical protein